MLPVEKRLKGCAPLEVCRQSCILRQASVFRFLLCLRGPIEGAPRLPDSAVLPQHWPHNFRHMVANNGTLSHWMTSFRCEHREWPLPLQSAGP